jgi:hypothetical protein
MSNRMNMSRLSIRQEIARLNRLAPRVADYSYIEKTYRKLTEGLHTVVGMSSGGEVFFRVRRNLSNKPASVEELAAPPAKFVMGYQRCNPPGIPMFYASSTRLGALLESRLELGEKVYIGQWIGKDQMPVNRIFDTPENQSVPGVDPSTVHGPNDDLLITHFDTLFTKRVHFDFSDDYKFTSAIAQHLTSHFPPNNEHNVHDDGFVALKFASVADIGRTHNTAMHASFAKERLELLHVIECEIMTVAEDHIGIRVTDNAVNIEGGMIEWSGKPNLVPAFRDGAKSVPFRFDGKAWKLELHQGDITDPLIEALLAE